MEKNKPFELSKRELDVMNVLWSAGEGIIASNIPKMNPELSINTVQVVLKNLIKKNFVKIDEIVYSGTVLTRSYSPVLTAEEYARNHIQAEAASFDKFISKSGLISALLDSADNDDTLIDELEAMIQERKRRK